MAQTFDEAVQNAQLDALNERVEELSAETPIAYEELIAVTEVSLMEALAVLAGYVFESQSKIMQAMGSIPDLGDPTADQFAEAYRNSYLIDKQARVVALLEDKHAPQETQDEANTDDDHEHETL